MVCDVVGVAFVVAAAVVVVVVVFLCCRWYVFTTVDLCVQYADHKLSAM